MRTHAKSARVPSQRHKRLAQPVQFPTSARLSTLSQLPPPLLTVYLDTNPKRQENLRQTPAYSSWLKTEGKSVLANVLPAEQHSFREQLARVERFLTGKARHQRGLLIFAGSATWEEIPLPVDLENELHWGKPALSQLQTISDKEKPGCVVAIDRAGARFLRYQFGEINELGQSEFNFNVRQWKRKDYGHSGAPAKLSHGAQRDAFNRRMEAQYQHLYGLVAKQTNKFCTKEQLAWTLLIGSPRMVEPLRQAFRPELRRNIGLLEEDLARIPFAELKAHVASNVERWMAERTERRVSELLNGDGRTVVGLDETLAQLQNGRISTLLMTQAFDADLRQCAKCGLVNRSADPVCSSCGSERQPVRLREILPTIARRQETTTEIVGGAAATNLEKAGGIGGWLRPE
jgi:hypothetical protein